MTGGGANRLPPLIYLDVRIPGMNGGECGRQIRQIDKNVTICFITGYSDKSSLQLAIEVGGDGDKVFFLRKPVDNEVFRQTTRSFISKWHMQKKMSADIKALKHVNKETFLF